MLARLAGPAWAVAAACSGAAAWAGPVTVQLQLSGVSSYWSATNDGGFQWNNASWAGANNGNAAVGHLGGTDVSTCSQERCGYYAALMQFALPSLPANAVVTQAMLGFTLSSGGNGLIDVDGYTTSSAVLDPAHIGTDPTSLSLMWDGEYDISVTSLILPLLGTASSGGGYVGFSFHHETGSCPSIHGVIDYCLADLGSATNPYGTSPVPTLRITYDMRPTGTDPDPSAVPEPASWALVATAGLALMGARRRRIERS